MTTKINYPTTVYKATSGTGNLISACNNSVHVKGDAEFEGDVKIKGKSLSEALNKIEERLVILHTDEKLEAKWEELKKLGNAYRALEKDILEKENIWGFIKK